MHHATPLITTIVGGLVLAFILGMIANKLRISPLVGYLLAGVLAGPFTPGFVADTKLAPELAELGVILLMFGVGLHFSLKDLMAVKSIAIPGAIAQIAVATLLGMALSAVLGWSLMVGIVFGLCLSTASTVVLLRALEERQLIDSQRGQIAIGWLIVEDLMMVLTLVLLPAVAGMLEKEDVGFASLAVDMGITIGKVVAFIAIMMLVGRRLVPWIMARSAATGSRELFTLSVLALALGIAFGAVELFDVSFALGAFFAGMVLNESELSHRAAHDTLPLRDAFAVLFFVSVGMLFDPLVLIQQPLAVLGTLAIIIFGKSLAAYFWCACLVTLNARRSPLPPVWRKLVNLPLSGGSGNGVKPAAAGRTESGAGRGNPVHNAQPGAVRGVRKISRQNRNAGRADSGRGYRRREANSGGYLQSRPAGWLWSRRQPAG